MAEMLHRADLLIGSPLDHVVRIAAHQDPPYRINQLIDGDRTYQVASGLVDQASRR
jgi:hypothetical protein